MVVVDDNRGCRRRAGGQSRPDGTRRSGRYSGGAALDTARAFKPEAYGWTSACLGMSGYEVARAIRSDQSLSTVLLVAITGWGQLDDRRKAREAGFDHHWVKPVDTGDIEQLLAGAADVGARRAE